MYIEWSQYMIHVVCYHVSPIAEVSMDSFFLLIDFDLVDEG